MCSVPAFCNADCATVFLSYWADCKHLLTQSLVSKFQTTFKACQKTQNHGSGSGGLARQLDVVCADDSAAHHCIPHCNALLHGDLLMLNIDGNDHKFSCEFKNGLYSWVGPAAFGGYLGQDVLAFLAAVISSAEGLFNLLLGKSASISTALTIKPGQRVRISGNASMAEAPSWGSGGFTVGELGELSLTHIRVSGKLAVSGGGGLSLGAMDLLLEFLQSLLQNGIKGQSSTVALRNVNVHGLQEECYALSGSIVGAGWWNWTKPGNMECERLRREVLGLLDWPESYTFKGTVQYTKGSFTHKGIVGEYRKTTVMCVN
jgi:hypothetical protein